MASVLAVLVPTTEDSRWAVVMPGNRMHSCKISALSSPTRELLSAHHSPDEFVILFDLDRMRGETGLSFGTSRANHVRITGQGVTASQFLLSVDPTTRSLRVGNTSTDRLDVDTGKNVRKTPMWVHREQRLRKVAPGRGMDLGDRCDLVAGRRRIHSFRIFMRPGGYDALFNSKLNRFIHSVPNNTINLSHLSAGDGSRATGNSGTRFIGGGFIVDDEEEETGEEEMEMEMGEDTDEEEDYEDGSEEDEDTEEEEDYEDGTVEMQDVA